MQEIGQEKKLEVVVDLGEFEVDEVELFDQLGQFVVVSKMLLLQLGDLFRYVTELFDEKLRNRQNEEVQRVDHMKERAQTEVVVDQMKSLNNGVCDVVHFVLNKKPN